MSDKERGKKTGHEGREELSLLTDEELGVQAAQYGVSITNDDGTARDRQEIVNEVANKVRQETRQADKPAKGEAPA